MSLPDLLVHSLIFFAYKGYRLAADSDQDHTRSSGTSLAKRIDAVAGMLLTGGCDG